MASTYFVHGNAVTVAGSPAGSGLVSGGLERVNDIAFTEVTGLRQGWGTTYRGKAGSLVWFHLPFVAPTVVDGVRSNLLQFKVFFDVLGPAVVESVHLWDNLGNRTFARDGLLLQKDLTFDFDPPQRIGGAIGLSLGARFTNAATITFRGAMVVLE
jgi:hypothetical protein